MTNQKTRRILIAAVAAVMAVAWLCGFIKVNVENPPVPRETYYEGDAYVTHDVSFTMTGHRMLDGDATASLLLEVNPEAYQPLVDDYNAGNKDMRMLLVTIKAKNIGSKRWNAAFAGVSDARLCSQVQFFSLMYHDVAEYKNAEMLGEDWSALETGEEKEWTMYFYMENSWMTPHWWAQVETMPYDFVLTDYPIDARFSTASKPE